MAQRLHGWRRRGAERAWRAGSAPAKTEAAPCVVTPLLESPAAGRPNWTIPRLIAEIKARGGVARGRPQRSAALRKKRFAGAGPRHTLKARQIAAEVDRAGLRLRLRRAQAEAGDIVLLYADEDEAPTHPYLARAWAKRGAGWRVPAPGNRRKSSCWARSTDRGASSASSLPAPSAAPVLWGFWRPSIDSTAPGPGAGAKPVVIVLDNGPIHVGNATLAALAARAHWLTVEWRPNYAPERTDIEVVWHDLKAFHLAPKPFPDADRLDAAIHTAAADLNAERNRDLLDEQRLSA